MTHRSFALVLLLFWVWSNIAQAQSADIEPSRAAQVERLRLQMTNEIQLQAYDLLDELVYSWIQSPPFGNPTPVVLAEVSAPMGFGSGLEALVETHLAQLLIANRKSNVVLSHCPACHALTVSSSQKGTIISRGIDQPGALEKIGGSDENKHGLFLDFETEGTSLILRARMTTLVEGLPIVYARTLSTQTSTAPLLREPDKLTSAKQARDDYVATLEQRGNLSFVTRLQLVQFASAEDSAIPIIAPILWLHVGGEMALTSKRAWLVSVNGAGAWIPNVYTGFLGNVRFSRLLTGSSTSLTHPDLYLFLGASLVSIQGPAAVVFRDDAPTIQEIIANVSGIGDAQASFPSLQVGFEVRINNRVSASFFGETTPTLQNAEALGNYYDFGFFQLNNLGGEVSFYF